MPLTTDERAELRATARSLLEQKSAPEAVRAAVATPAGYDEALWGQMVELGWTTIHLPEQVGGGGCGYVDLAVVLHELGRAITPSPFLASAVLASGALALADGSTPAGDLLASVAGGETRGTVALAASSGSYEPGRSSTTWRSDGSTLRLDGASGFVLDADLADVIVLAALDGDGLPAVVAVDASAGGVRIEQVPMIDATRRCFTVNVDDVVVPEDRLLCAPGSDARALIQQVHALGVIAVACETAGTAERALERTVEYAKERTQFGKPIGSFQAVKHHCANMAIAVEASRAATRGAAEALDGESAGWATNASITASFVGPACSQAMALALLVHGGIGFTWEHDSHLYLKRTKLDEVLFGTPSWHRRRLADAVFPGLVAPGADAANDRGDQ